MVNDDRRRRYRILGTIGKGGFGTVYRAELIGESGFSKVVALKVLNPEVSEVAEIAERLRDEARVLGLVHHRAIVQVDALLQLDRRWTIVMEYVQGTDMKHLIARGPLPPGPALEIVTEVANALRAAREQLGPDGKPLALLHRDIKPSNLHLTPSGEVKVLDFGTARANFEGREAKTQQLAFGTLDYMAPERMEFIDVPAGDVYALGSVLFEMLVGQQLGRTSPRPTRHQELRRNAVTRLEAAGVHEGVIALIRDMIAFEPSDRPELREIEQRCRELRVVCGGPWLSDWASEVVPKILAQRTMADIDEMTGVVLEEGTGAHRLDIGEQGETRTSWVPMVTEPEPVAPPPVPSPPRTVRTVRPEDVIVGARPPPRRRVGLVAIIAGALGLVLVAVAGLAVVIVVVGRMNRGEVPEPATTVQEAPAVEAPEEARTEPTEGPTAPEATTPAPPVSRPAPRRAPRPATRPAPTVTPRPAPATPTAHRTGRVVVQGDATAVTLVTADGRSLGPGSVPAGTYDIEATFEGRGEVSAGSVTVPAGGTVTIRCQRAFARCSVY